MWRVTFSGRTDIRYFLPHHCQKYNIRLRRRLIVAGMDCHCVACSPITPLYDFCYSQPHLNLRCHRRFFQEARHSQGQVVACLEEKYANGQSLAPQCSKQLLRLAELSADDFNLDRNLYFKCRDDREKFCDKVRVFMVDLSFVSN